MIHKSLRHIRSRYGISPEQYQEMYDKQGGLCAGCGKKPKAGGKSNANRKLFIDHNHTTNDIRGLLCQGCNASIGLAGDNPTTLRQLADYLEKEPIYTAKDIADKDSGRRMRERTHCKNGHEYTEENTRWRKWTNREKPGRECRICVKVWESNRKPRVSATGTARVAES